MAKIIGRTGAVGIAVEATRGTAEAIQYWVPVQSYSYDDKVGKIKNDSAQGRIEEFNAMDVIQRWGEGDFEGKIFVNSIGAELVALFGQSPTSAERGTSDVFDHTYAVANNNAHKSLTIGYKDAISDDSFPFAMIDSWSLEVSTDDYVKRSISLIGKKSISGSHTPSFTDEVEFIPSHVSFKMADAIAGLGAATAVNITNFSMEVKKNAETTYAVGSNEPEDNVNKQFGVTGSIELYFENETYRDYVLNNLGKAIRIDMIDTTVDLGTGHNPQLRFDLNQVKFEEFERSWDANDPLKQTLNFEALFKRADASMIEARLTNTVVSY
jgi:hypothetical protein